MTELRMKHYEPYAAARRDWANLLRKVRSDNPAMARLLLRRINDARRVMASKYWSASSENSVFSQLLDG